VTRLLLDTNVIINIVNRTDKKLPRSIRTVLESEEVSFRASVVSIWEIAIKRATGRLKLEVTPHDVPKILAMLKVDLLPMTIDHALEVAHPEPATKDPFDRLLLAVCACEGMKLVTTDEKLAGHRLVY
jgi:PIN domain nuclease of toxin-antitoxin system